MLLVSDLHAEEYKKRWLSYFQDQSMNPYEGYVKKDITIRSRNSGGLQLNIFLTYTNDRFHEMSLELPKDAYVQCIEHADSKFPCIFVKDEWLRNFLTTNYCCYGLIDEIDFKDKYLRSENVTRYLSKRIDAVKAIADKYQNVSFIIFSDSILLKLPWSLDKYEMTYQPELMVSIFKEVREFYVKELKSDCFVIFIQGVNFDSTKELIVTGENKNLIDLNCAGSAFANLFYINDAISKKLKNKEHKEAVLYFDEKFLVSLKISHDIKERLSSNMFSYYSPLYKSHENYVVDENSLVLDCVINASKQSTSDGYFKGMSRKIITKMKCMFQKIKKRFSLFS